MVVVVVNVLRLRVMVVRVSHGRRERKDDRHIRKLSGGHHCLPEDQLGAWREEEDGCSLPSTAGG